MKNLTLIHYKGNSSVAAISKEHVRTCPSVLRNVKLSEQSPSVVYKKEVSNADCSYEHHLVLLPRNRKQVENMQSIQRQKFRISHDALYNVHELSYDLQEFVHKIVTFPDVAIVCGLKHILNRLLQVQLEASSHVQQLLSYDMTFKLGDFYVSPLLFRNILFINSPVMPAFF